MMEAAAAGDSRRVSKLSLKKDSEDSDDDKRVQRLLHEITLTKGKLDEIEHKSRLILEICKQHPKERIFQEASLWTYEGLFTFIPERELHKRAQLWKQYLVIIFILLVLIEMQLCSDSAARSENFRRSRMGATSAEPRCSGDSLWHFGVSFRLRCFDDVCSVSGAQ